LNSSTKKKTEQRVAYGVSVEIRFEDGRGARWRHGRWSSDSQATD